MYSVLDQTSSLNSTNDARTLKEGVNGGQIMNGQKVVTVHCTLLCTSDLQHWYDTDLDGSFSSSIYPPGASTQRLQKRRDLISCPLTCYRCPQVSSSNKHNRLITPDSYHETSRTIFFTTPLANFNPPRWETSQ